MYAYETEEWEKMIAAEEENLRKNGGGGSNMAEPLYFKPGPLIPDGLPPEEVARRKEALKGIEEMLERAAAHSEAAAKH